MNFFAAATMGDTALEKTAEVLRHEIDELRRQQREVQSSPPQSHSQFKSPFQFSFFLTAILYRNQITERLRDPRGIRRGGLSGAGPRNQPRRGFLRPVISLSFLLHIVLFFELC